MNHSAESLQNFLRLKVPVHLVVPEKNRTTVTMDLSESSQRLSTDHFLERSSSLQVLHGSHLKEWVRLLARSHSDDTLLISMARDIPFCMQLA